MINKANEVMLGLSEIVTKKHENNKQNHNEGVRKRLSKVSNICFSACIYQNGSESYISCQDMCLFSLGHGHMKQAGEC